MKQKGTFGLAVYQEAEAAGATRSSFDCICPLYYIIIKIVWFSFLHHAVGPIQPDFGPLKPIMVFTRAKCTQCISQLGARQGNSFFVWRARELGVARGCWGWLG